MKMTREQLSVHNNKLAPSLSCGHVPGTKCCDVCKTTAVGDSPTKKAVREQTNERLAFSTISPHPTSFLLLPFNGSACLELESGQSPDPSDSLETKLQPGILEIDDFKHLT